jgi:hypothetical protein
MVSQMMPPVVRAMDNVVDSNLLQTGALRKYLNASTENRVVVAPFVAMEAYKGDTLKSIYSSMRILCGYPRQVVILKGASVVCGLQGTAEDSPIIVGTCVPQNVEIRQFRSNC